MTESNLPVPARGRGKPPVISKGDGSDLKQDSKYHSLAHAMRVAKERLQIEEQDDFDPDPDPYGYAQEFENELGIQLLEPQWKAKPDDQRWVRRIKRRSRKAAVARLYLMGYSPHEIAVRVKTSETTVYADIKAVSAEWRRSYLDDIEVLASRDLARLDEMFQKLSPAIEQGEVKSIQAAVEIIRERGNILGYRHGVSVDIEQHIRELATSQGMDPDQAVLIAQRISVRYK